MNECQFSHSELPKSVGLRFFTVYGPMGRPDMATWQFTQSIYEGRPIQLFGYGKMLRDFTYVGDIVEGIKLVIDHMMTKQNPGTHEIFNTHPFEPGI